MSILTYTATKELTPGTPVSSIVNRQIRLVSFPRKIKSINKQNTSLSGNVESLLVRSEVHYNCRTGLIEPRSQDDLIMFEFFASVQNGEQFNFDRYGTIAEPDNIVSCIMVSNSFAEVEKSKVFHQFGFVIRER